MRVEDIELVVKRKASLSFENEKKPTVFIVGNMIIIANLNR
jgi:hypothetical protein